MVEKGHVIKAIGPDYLESIERMKKLEEYYGVVHYVLFDTTGKGHGGTGEKFDWALLEKYRFPVPYFLSGGIGPEDVEPIRKMEQLWFHGVDVNSGFEDAPGRKNIELLESFMKKIRK